MPFREGAAVGAIRAAGQRPVVDGTAGSMWRMASPGGYAQLTVSEADLEEAFRASPLFQHLERLGEAGPDPIPDSDAKRHHFIPQFLLRQFVAPERERLYQIDIASGKPQAVAPAAAASRRHFYAVTDEDGTRHNKLESYLSIVEGYAADALVRFLDHPSGLAASDRATLAYFFGLIGLRTPRATEGIAAGSDAIAMAMFGSHLVHPDVFARHYRDVVGEGTEEEIEQLRHEMLAAIEEGRVKLEDPRANALGLGLTISADLALTIYPADWTLLRTQTAFVTSDTGLSMHDPTPPLPWTGNAWFSSPQAETAIPLSSSACLLITLGNEARIRELDATDDETDRLNLRAYGWASDYAYGESQEVVVELRRLAKRRPTEVPSPRPVHNTILVDADPDDPSLADEHRRRGWPPYLQHDGVPHDYIVVGLDGTPVEAGARASRLARERAAEGR